MPRRGVGSTPSLAFKFKMGCQSRCVNPSKFLANAQVEPDRLHRVVQRGGYKLAFRGPNGIIIDYLRSAQNGASKRQAQVGLVRGVLRRVRAYVEVNPERKIRLADLAAVANLSRCHFAHAFKQSLGRTPHRYVMFHVALKKRAILLGRATLGSWDCAGEWLRRPKPLLQLLSRILRPLTRGFQAFAALDNAAARDFRNLS
jgi:AraC-like DNA-binding protein